MLHDIGQLLEPEQASLDLEEHLLHIALASGNGAELDIVLVFAVAYREAPQRYVHAAQGVFHVAYRNAGLPQALLVGNYKQLRRDSARDIDHCHLGELFDAFGYHLRGKTAQLDKLIRHGMQLVEPVRLRLLLERHVDIESGNVRGTGLYNLRTFYLARQGRCTTVDLFVNLDEDIVYVRALLERQLYRTAAFARLAAYIRKLRYLH